jgi:hypothetical protein
MIHMASTNLTVEIKGFCYLDLTINGRYYQQMKLLILQNLCSDIILGHDFMKQHDSVNFSFGGSLNPITLCNVMAMKIETPRIFQHLSSDCKPIASNSRRFSKEDSLFIKQEVVNLLEEGIIERSNSPWRAQVLVTHNERHKRRMVVDYSQTINRFTLLDAYPLPKIDMLVQSIAKYNYFSRLDLKSAYYQIPLHEEDKPFTAFEANGELYHYNRLPFGLTNAVAAFQRVMNEFVLLHNIKGAHIYLDDVVIGGVDLSEHDANLQRFLDCAKKSNITFNDSKCSFRNNQISFLGYHIKAQEIRPDADRLKPLHDLRPPSDKVSLQKVMGLFSYYSQWIANFSEKVHPILKSTTFPLQHEAMAAFNSVKEDIEKAANFAINEVYSIYSGN